EGEHEPARLDAVPRLQALAAGQALAVHPRAVLAPQILHRPAARLGLELEVTAAQAEVLREADLRLRGASEDHTVAVQGDVLRGSAGGSHDDMGHRAGVYAAPPMCTVAFVPLPAGGYLLGHNRDERPSRPAGEPPRPLEGARC